MIPGCLWEDRVIEAYDWTSGTIPGATIFLNDFQIDAVFFAYEFDGGMGLLVHAVLDGNGEPKVKNGKLESQVSFGRLKIRWDAPLRKPETTGPQLGEAQHGIRN